MILKQLTINILLFLISVIGLVLNRRHILITLMCIELILLSLNLNLKFYLYKIYNLKRFYYIKIIFYTFLNNK